MEKYRAFELIHARWAMLAAAGIIIPEGLQANGAAIRGGTWFETGAEMLDGGTLNYFAVPWGVINNPLPLVVVTAIEAGLLFAVENYRQKGQGPPGYSPGVGKFDSDIFDGLDNLYPGGPFDPLGLADDPEVFDELRVKEIKNGRLAMIAVLVSFMPSHHSVSQSWGAAACNIKSGCKPARTSSMFCGAIHAGHIWGILLGSYSTQQYAWAESPATDTWGCWTRHSHRHGFLLGNGQHLCLVRGKGCTPQWHVSI